MWQDVRHAVRVLRTHPGFVAIGALVLALGIGLNTAIFSVVYAMLFKPLPVESPGDLVSIYGVTSRQPDRPSVIHSRAGDFYQKHSGILSDLTMHWGISYPMRADDETDTVNVEWVRSNYFDVLGVKPVIGRALLPAEDSVATPERALVISHALWAKRFKSDPQIIGRQVAFVPWSDPELTFTIVGVMAPGFHGVNEPWRPTQAWMTFAQGRGARGYFAAAIGRLKPGVTFRQAQAVVEAQSGEAGKGIYAPGIEPRYLLFKTNTVRIPNDPSATVVPMRLATAMTVVVAMVLLVAATNIAGILMARGVGRSGEIAVRRVLGAGPLRIVRQLLAESLLLSALGGILGFVLAWWLLTIFERLTPLQYAIDAAMEPAVVAFTTAVCVVAGIVVGIMPARQATRLDVLPWLAGSGGVQSKQSRRRLRHAITVPQVTLSLVLLLVAGVYVRALLEIEGTDVGYDPVNVVVANPMFRLQPGERAARPDGSTEEKYAERSRRFYQQLLERLRGIPGARDVAIAEGLPLREPSERPNWFAVSQDDFLAGRRQGPPAERVSISPGYFDTMRMSVRQGRSFDDRDTSTAPKVAIVSAALASRLWPGRDALGRSFTILNSWEASNKKLEWFEVIGVASDVSPVLHDREVRPFLYLPLGQQWSPASSYVLVRGDGDSRALIPGVRAAITGSDPFADVRRVQTLRQLADEILYPRRVAASILAASGAIALLLATIGIYGVVSYSVAQRTGEIGVRMALGAERGDVIRLVLREGAVVAVVGSAAGLVLGYAAVRLVSSKYLALPQLDLAALVITPLVLTAVVLFACYLPARRAGSVDAMEVLRRL